MKAALKKNITVLAIMGSIAVFVAVIFIQKEKTKEQIPAKKVKLTLGLALQPTSSLAIIAKEKGFFSAEGLNVETKAYPSGKRVLKEGLLHGTVDIAVSSDIPVMTECLNNTGIRIISAIGSTDNVNRIVARADRNITEPDDLKGKRIATQNASAVHYFLYLFFHEHDIKENETRISFMKAEELVPALVKGKIDAFSMREPYVTEAQRLLDKNAVIFAAPGIYPQSELAVTTADFAASHPEAIEKFLKALVKAETFAKEHPEEAMMIIAKRLGVDRAGIRKFWKTLNLEVSLEQSLIMLLENQARWAVRESLVKKNRVPDYTDYLYLKGITRVKPQSVSIIR